MKKFSKILFGVIAAFILCITSVNFSEASIKTDQKNSIKKYHSLVKGTSGDYKIVDINGDKVKDLLWMDTDSGYYKVYTYRNNKLKCMKKFDYARGGNIYYNTKKHIVIMVRGQFGGNETYVYKAGKTSLKQLKKYSQEYIPTKNGKKTVYRINNKKVSKSTYNKNFSSYKKGCKALWK